MKLSTHFSLEELTHSVTAHNRGIDNSPSDAVLFELKKLAENVLEPLRLAYGKPIVVTSGYRCLELNKAVRGAATSQHLKGQAADITSLANTPEENKRLFDCAVRLIESGKIRVGQCIDEYGYKWVHISTPFRKVNQVLHLR